MKKFFITNILNIIIAAILLFAFNDIRWFLLYMFIDICWRLNHLRALSRILSLGPDAKLIKMSEKMEVEFEPVEMEEIIYRNLTEKQRKDLEDDFNLVINK